MHTQDLIPNPKFTVAAVHAYPGAFLSRHVLSALAKQPETSIPVAIAKIQCNLIGTLHSTRNTLKVMLRNAGWTQVAISEHSASWHRKDLFGCPLVYLTVNLKATENGLVELRFELKADRVRSISQHFAERFLGSFAEKICA